MSQIVVTNEGWRFNHITGATWGEWMLQMPCGAWEPLSEDQLAGRLSVNHGAICGCGYHETHPYGEALVSALRARILVGPGADRAGEDDAV